MSENESGDISQHPAVIWLRELLGQTDRGCIIVAHAFFDEEVGEVLRKHFQACGSKEKLCSELLGGENGGYAPLRGLLLRVKLAVALGLLDSDLLPIFDRLNTLRNQFAHRTRAKDLTKLHIESLLQTAQETLEASPSA